MKKNMGTADRWIRIVLGLIAGAAGLYLKSWWGLVGLPLIGTALISWCPLYVPFGFSTKRNS